MASPRSSAVAPPGSQSSSIETDQPLATAQSASGQALLRTQDSASFDSRTFMGIVSEKQARVYQVPMSPLQQAGGAQQSGSVAPATSGYTATSGKGSSSSASSASDGHHGSSSAHHHHQKLSKEQPSLEDLPMAKLLANSKQSASNCCSKIDLTDSSFVAAANIIQWRQPDEYCLITYLGTGNVVIYSLPLMRQLFEVDFIPLTNPRISSSMRFSRNGHCLYQPSKNEILKFSLNSQYKLLLNDMCGSLYVPREMPEMPRGGNFFKSLFSVTNSMANKISERDELFGNESIAGKPSRGVAKHVGSSSSSAGFDKLKSAAVGTMGHDLRMAREGLDERGEKLGDIEDKTLQMMNQAESYAQAAHHLAQKFKDKKWYQF